MDARQPCFARYACCLAIRILPIQVARDGYDNTIARAMLVNDESEWSSYHVVADAVTFETCPEQVGTPKEIYVAFNSSCSFYGSCKEGGSGHSMKENLCVCVCVCYLERNFNCNRSDFNTDMLLNYVFIQRAGPTLYHLAISIAVEDTLFYWSHRTLHHPRIYKYIHKVQPFPLLNEI